MKIKVNHLVLTFLLTVIFTVGLIFATINLPGLINHWIIRIFDFPGVDSSIEQNVTEAFVQSNHIRIIGFICLTLLIGLIVMGIITEKKRLASIGAVAFFLPTFGHFALNMFFLAGLGILRIIWMPLLDISYNLLNLGDIAYLPYMIIIYPFALIGLDIRTYFIYFCITAGIFIFLSGTFTWLYTRLQGEITVNWGIYRFSRHPQYLGWILWSYGVMLFVSRIRGPRIMYSLGNSLPWLLSTMVILFVALREEIQMKKMEGYASYCSTTPFFLPLPIFITRFISAPQRWLLKKDHPENGHEVFLMFLLYTGILMLLSLPFVLFQWPPDSGWFRFPYNVPPFS